MSVYENDLDMMVKLCEALLVLQELMEKHPVSTPCAMVAYNTVMFGIIPRINTPCEQAEDGVCVVETSIPCGGIDDALKCIDEAIEQLMLEVQMGEVSEAQALADTEEL